MGGGTGLTGNYGQAKGEETQRYYAADPEAAKRLADIAERQMGMAEEAWSIYQTDFLPYEQAMIQANIDMIDPQQELMTAQIGAEAELTPARQEATQAALDDMVKDIEEGRPVKTEMLRQQLAQLEAEGRLLSDREELARTGLQEALADIEAGRPLKTEMLKQNLAQLQAEGRLLPAREEAAAAGLKQRTAETEAAGRLLPEREKAARLGLEQVAKEIGLSGPAAEKFYKEATEGVSAEEYRGEASADVEQTYGQALKEARRDLSRAGVAPGSKKYQEMMADMIYQKAKAGAGARTSATREAGKESFRRLGAAMAVRGRPTGGMGVRAQGVEGALPTTRGVTPTGGYPATGVMAGGRTGPMPVSMATAAPGVTPYRAGGLAQPSPGAGTMAGGLMAGAGATSAAGLRPQKTTKESKQEEWGVTGGMQF